MELCAVVDDVPNPSGAVPPIQTYCGLRADGVRLFVVGVTIEGKDIDVLVGAGDAVNGPGDRGVRTFAASISRIVAASGAVDEDRGLCMLHYVDLYPVGRTIAVSIVDSQLQDDSASTCPVISCFERALQVNREKFQVRRDQMMAAFDQVAEVKYIKPDGAFYLFCDFSSLGVSLNVAKQILDDVNVAIIPGEGFGAPGFMRLSFATSTERIAEGTKRISEWIKKRL